MNALFGSWTGLGDRTVCDPEPFVRTQLEAVENFLFCGARKELNAASHKRHKSFGDSKIQLRVEIIEDKDRAVAAQLVVYRDFGELEE